MKRFLIFSAVLLLLTSGCSAPGQNPPPAATQPPTAPAPDNTIRFQYRNVSLVTPPFYSNMITAEHIELREQHDPSDDVPSYIQINFRDPLEVNFGPDDIYSQVLVYPFADLIQTYPEAADAALRLRGVIKERGEMSLAQLPFWPLFKYSGVVGAPLKSYGQLSLSAQAKLLDFGSGHGVRYLTLLAQQPPRSHRLDGMIYTFQGLTDDGLYYVSVVIPIIIPGDNTIDRDLELMAEQAAPDYGGIAEALRGLAPNQFYLSLDDCDAFVRSVVVSP